MFRFVWAKIVVLLLAAGIGLFASRTGRVPRPIGIILGLGVLLLVVAALLSADPEAAFLGRWPRYEGVLVLGLYAGMLMLGVKVLGGGEKSGRWTVLLRALAAVSLVVATVTCLEAAGLRPLGGAADLRPGATLGNASDQGLIGSMLTAVLALPSLQKGRYSWFLRAGCASGVLTAILSGSRAALLSLAVAVIATGLAILFTKRGLNRRKVAGGIGALVVVAILILLLPGARDRLLTSATVSGRWLLWGLSMNMVKDRPWSGVGPSGFVDVFPSYQSQQWATEVGGDFPPDSPHNLLLQAAMAGGIPLVLLTFLLGGMILRLAFLKIKAADDLVSQNLVGAFAAVSGYAAGLLAGFTSPGTTPLAMFLCGGLVAAAGPARPAFRGRWEPLAARVKASKFTPLIGAGAIMAALVIAVPAMTAEWSMDAGARSVRDGDLTAAEGQFQNAYSLRPWDSDTALLVAQSFAGRAADGDQKAAQRTVEWATSALKRTPGSVEAGLALCIGDINTGNLPAAKIRLDELISRAPYTTELYIQRGVANFGLGHPEESLTDLKTAANQTPTSPVPWQIIGAIYDRLGEHDNAAAAKRHADQLTGSRPR